MAKTQRATIKELSLSERIKILEIQRTVEWQQEAEEEEIANEPA